MTVRRACALTFLAAVAAYWGTLDNGFAWDDLLHVTGDPFVSDPTNVAVLLSADFWRGKLAIEGSGRPLLLASFLVDRAYWADLAAGYHLTNLLLHGATAAALTALAAGLLSSPVAGLAAGLFFAAHPALSEAVCCVAFRGELLAALFGLLALLARRRACGAGGAGWLAASAACFALALLSKENAVAWPVLALLDELFAPAAARLSPRRAAAQALVFAAVLGGYAAFRLPRGDYAALRPAPPPVPAPPTPASTPKGPAVPLDAPRSPASMDPSTPAWADDLGDRATRLRTMTGVFFDYARLAAWPAGLQADRVAPVLKSWAAPRFWAGALILAALLAAAWTQRRARPVASLGALWFLAALAPVSGLLPLYNLVAERYLYMPMAGAALCAAALFEAARRGPRPRLALGVAAALLVAAGVATARRVGDWRDDASLFGARVVTDSSRLRYNRGRLAREGGRFEEAAAEYRRALELNPRSFEALVNLAEVEASVGRFDEQLALLRRAAAVAPHNAVALSALAAAEERAGHLPEALRQYERALMADPTLALPRMRYAEALQRAGRPGEALQQADQALKLDPKSFEAAYLLGRLGQENGIWSRCMRGMRAARRLDRHHALTLANLGICTHLTARQEGDPELMRSAIGPLRLAATKLPGSGEVRGALAALYMDLGMLPQAQEAYAEALAIDARSPQLWHDYGVAQQRGGRAEGAVEAYERALLINPTKVESLVNLASLRAAAGRFDEARALIDRAERARPYDPVIRSAANAVERARNAAEAK
ncbi:MAG: tetratricopeptide repeat protein [Elusimicrobiota bacterium]|nr:tetratricopeptide repeat protein [Elusimicrobiota bacterium]